jgi:uncharacterized protein (TIGR02271 family)
VISPSQLDSLAGATLTGADGSKLGTVDALYTDQEGGQPTFLTVHTGLFGTRTSFVPLAEATADGSSVTVPYTKEQVKDAPTVDADGAISPEEEQRLYAHYGLTGQTATAPTAGTTASDNGYDTSGPSTDDAMTRSEERLHVGTEKAEVGRAKLRKYIVSETQTRTVPVSHDEVRIEREPITEGNIDKALDGPALSEEEHEVVLTAERPVVAKETVPVERVRVAKETVTEQAQVSEDVRKEQIEADGVYPDDERTGTRTGVDQV